MTRILETMTAEKMTAIYTDAKLRNAVADPCKCYDRNCQFMHLKAVSYPVEYIVTEEQAAEAKAELKRAKDKVFADHYNDLLFAGMGMEYAPRYEDDVCNHRIRTEFLNRHGHRFLIEVSHTTQDGRMWVTFALDRDKQIELHDDPDRQSEFYNFHNLQNRDLGLAYTRDNILRLVNEHFDCCFRNIVIDQHTIGMDDREILCESPKQ